MNILNNGVIYESKFCLNCQKQMLVFKTEPNHLLHLAIAFIFDMSWIFIWLILIILNNKSWRCTACGTITRNED